MPTKGATPHIRLRLEPRLLQRIEKAREKSGRTLTGEIAHRLEQSFAKDNQEELVEHTATASASASVSGIFKVLRDDPETFRKLIESMPPFKGGKS
jgi:hypothetical protein